LGGCFGKTPDKYVDLLKAAYASVKEVDRDGKVVTGGMALGQYIDPKEGPIFNTDFFDQVLALGGGDYFDIANIHYFSSQGGAWSSYGRDLIGKVTGVRQIMTRYGVTRPMMVTELGWTSSPKDSPDTPEMQARYVPKALARGLAVDLYAMTWFSLKDWEGADYPYGLMDVGGRLRPAYQAFQAAVSEFGDATAIRPLAPGELGVAGGVEGYAFSVGGKERWVIWAEGTNQIHAMLPAGVFEARDKLGQAVTLPSGSSPKPIALGDSPLYIRFR